MKREMEIIKGYIMLAYYWVMLNLVFPLLQWLVSVLIKLNSLRKDV